MKNHEIELEYDKLVWIRCPNFGRGACNRKTWLSNFILMREDGGTTGWQIRRYTESPHLWSAWWGVDLKQEFEISQEEDALEVAMNWVETQYVHKRMKGNNWIQMTDDIVNNLKEVVTNG